MCLMVSAGISTPDRRRKAICNFYANFAPMNDTPKSMALANERAPMDDGPTMLLAPDEPQPVTVTNAGGRSPLVIVADHAGNYLPRRLGRLGLPQAELERHIAWDMGV